MWPAVWGAVVLAAFGLVLTQLHRRWRQLTERERFFLGLKEATTPQLMDSVERDRLRLLRSRWWAFSRWLPDFWRQRSEYL